MTAVALYRTLRWTGYDPWGAYHRAWPYVTTRESNILWWLAQGRMG